MENKAQGAGVTGNVLSSSFLTFSMVLINSISMGEQLKLRGVFAWILRRRGLTLPGRGSGGWGWGWHGSGESLPRPTKNLEAGYHWACFKLFCKRKQNVFQ
jgi:hypothetical protein